MPKVSAMAAAPDACNGRGVAGSRSGDRPSQASASATAAPGRLMKKIQRHDAYCTSRPPSGGPIIVPMPLQAVHSPTARPLSAP